MAKLLQDPENLVAILQLLIAVGLVSIDALSRYNTPTTVRSETTWGKFVLGRMAYLGIVLGVFVVLLVSPQVLGQLFRHFSVAGSATTMFENVQTSLSFPLIVALFMTVLLVEIPGLARLDRAVRSYLHWISAIPRERRSLILCFKQAHLNPQDEERQAQLQRLAQDGVVADGSHFADGESVEHRLVRADFLLRRLQRLEALPKYADHLFHSDDYRGLKEAFGQKVAKAALLRDLAESGSPPRAVEVYRKDVNAEMERFLGTLYDFVSRLVLNAERTDRGRREAIAALGMEPPPRPPTTGMTIHEFLWLFILLIAFLAVSMRFDEPRPMLMAVIALNHALAAVIGLAIASLARQLVDQKAAADRPLPPIGYYLTAGVIGLIVASCFIIAYLVGSKGEIVAFINGDAQKAMVAFFTSKRWAYGLMAFATAATITVLADDWLEHRVRPLRARLRIGRLANLFDAVVMATALGVATMVVREILGPEARGAVLTHVLRSAAVGAIIGFWVPMLYRERQKGSEENAGGDAHGSTATCDAI